MNIDTDEHSSSELSGQETSSPTPVRISCVTGRGVYSDYWKHLNCYELSHQELSSRVSRLRQWKAESPSNADWVARIDPVVISEMFSDERGISSISEAAIARALSRVDALDAPLLLLHTPSSIRPSSEHERAVIMLRERLPAHLPLVWRADGLWGDSEHYFDLCASQHITPVIDPLMWDEDLSLPSGSLGYWKVMGGAGLSPRLSEYDLDKLLDLADQWLSLAELNASAEATQGGHTGLWVNFTSSKMYSAARRWRSSLM